MPAKKRRKTKARKPSVKRKTTTRKATAKRKKTVRKTSKNVSAIRSALNKSQLMMQIAESTDLSKKQVSSVFEELGDLMHRHLKKGGAGEFTIPGLMKCVVKHKPATKARKGINPFTGEPTTFKAKPARNVVKVRPLKKLKEMAK